MSVLEFNRKESHGSGWAVCATCRHEWVCVAPIGVAMFQCPSCGTFKGNWKYEFIPDENVSTCKCGGQLFYITEKGHLCINCGSYRVY